MSARIAWIRATPPLLLASTLIVLALPLAPAPAVPPPPPLPPGFANAAANTPAENATIAIARGIKFDVATFKLNRTGMPPKSLVFPPNGDGFIGTFRPIRDYIRYVYASPLTGTSFHFTNEPPWVDNDYYNIQAKVAAEDIAAWQKLNVEEEKIPLAGFLADYFKLRFHTDTHQYPYYSLIVAKGGPKLKLYKPTDTLKLPWNGQTITGPFSGWVSYNQYIAQGVTMAQLAEALTRNMGRNIVDKTGLPDRYDFTLTCTFDQTPEPDVPNASGRPVYQMPAEYSAPSIFVAIKQDLGLKLVSTKGPVEGIVIDHIERPPEN